MQNVTERVSNPFDMEPPCEEFVPGYGDPNADFHVVGDHPGVHGGAETGVPFTRSLAGERLQDVLAAVGLLESPGDSPDLDRVFFSYRYLCVPQRPEEPTAADYEEMERFFDAELRAITAHVLLPVGEGAIRHVLEHYTAIRPETVDVDSLHATEIRGSGWLVLPITDPRAWSDDDAAALEAGLEELLSFDYRRESDLGRFLAGGDPYFVR